MIIKTKWGKLVIDPNKIYEVNMQLNPWDNIYRLEFIMESHDRLNAELGNATELGSLIRRVTSEMEFVRQYKYKDKNGHMQINEPRRLSVINQMEKDK